MRLVREPLVWFAVVGTCLFLAWQALAPAPRDTILITSEAAEAVIRQNEAMTGVRANEIRRREITEGYIDDEVLLREAFRRGYHESDPRTRKRLLGVMRTTLTQAPPNPSRAQLEAYFRENLEKFVTGEVATYDQVLFTATSEKMPADPATVRADLVAGADFTEIGDRGMPFPMSTLTDQSRSRILADFGSAVFEAISTLPVGEWSQPLDSRGGIVLVRVKARRTLPPPAFDDIEDYVLEDYEYEMARASQSGKIADLRAKYRIEIEEPDSP